MVRHSAKVFLKCQFFKNEFSIWGNNVIRYMPRSLNFGQSKNMIEEIRAVYDTLPKSERPLADILLEFPGDLTLYSASELAERAGVSNAAVSRFFKRIGFRDYRTAREAVRAAQASGHPLYLNNSMPARPGPHDSLSLQLSQDIANLNATYDMLDHNVLKEAIQALTGAKAVYCVGYRNSYFFASYIRRQLIQLRPSVHLLPEPGQILMEEVAGIAQDDVAVFIGLRRRADITARAMEYLHARGVPILYITDHRADHTARLATWSLRCRTRGVSLFDSYVGVISLLNYICTEVAAAPGDASRRRMKLIEEANTAGDELEHE